MHDNLDKYKQLSDREHILLRGQMYLGSLDLVESEEYIFKNEKFQQEKVKYVPGLLKIINEIIDNSIDESVRTNFQYSNKIEVSIDEKSVRVVDNGRGIPVELMKGTDQYIPFVLFTSAKAGSNFSDDNRTTIGTNGIGSVATNSFSNYFEVNTHDGKKHFKLVCKENNKTQEFKIKDSDKNGTNVYFEPDVSRFKIDSISNVYIELIQQRLIFLSYTYPLIQFKINGQKINKCNDKKFIDYFLDNYEVASTDKWLIACGISETDDFKHLSYVNGLFIKNGGNHITYVSNLIINELRQKLERTYKSIKPSDIKNKLYLFVFFKGFPNMKFDSQTKETLTNSFGEIKDFVNTFDHVKFSKQIIKNEQIYFHIEENYKIKQEFQQRKELSNVVKVTKKIKIEKYLPPIDNQKYLTLSEGDSANNSLSAILGRKDFGFFPLRGKSLNTFDVPLSKITANEELKNILTILGIDITKPVLDMNYEKVLIASDADADGILIRGLLLTFFNRFTPDLIKQKRICFLNTPIMYTKGRNERADNWIYNLHDVDKLKGKIYYSKGLGSWKKEDLKFIIEKDGLNNMIQVFENDETTKEYINLWMGNNADLRKEQIKGLSFNYGSI